MEDSERMKKPIPWWWTEPGHEDMFRAAWEEYVEVWGCFGDPDYYDDRAFIAEQLVGEKWEEQ